MKKRLFSCGQYTIGSALNDRFQLFLDLVDIEDLDRKLAEEDIISLFKAYNEISKELALIKLENQSLENFLEINDPTQLSVIRDKIHGGKKQVTIKFLVDTQDEVRRSVPFRISRVDRASVEDADYISGRSSMPRQRREMSVTQNFTEGGFRTEGNLNIAIKMELAEKLVFQIEQETKKVEAQGERELIKLIAIRKELNLQINEVDQTDRSLQEIFPSNNQNNWMVKIPSERFIKYCQSWLKNGLALLSTMRIKINALKRQCTQQKANLVRKKDLSGALMPVDFQLMKIKRNKDNKLLENKTTQLIKLKQHSGEISTILAMHKKNMMMLENSLRAVNMELEMTKKLIDEMVQEKIEVVTDIQKSKENLIKLSEQIAAYQAPSIKSYIRIKEKLHNLQKEEKLLERKNYIFNIKLQNAKRKLASKKNQILFKRNYL